MALPSLSEMTERVRLAECNVNLAENKFGADSAKYREALKQFACEWFVLKQTREPDEFLKEVTETTR